VSELVQAPASSTRGRVVLLHDAAAADGTADARDVLAEARDIAGALAALGFESLTVPVGLGLDVLAARLEALAPRVVFNLVESLGGSGALIHVVPALLETLGVPFTGCSAYAQLSSSHKLVAKRRLRAAGLPTPETSETSDTGGPEVAWIVKSVWEHASHGLDDASIVADRGCVAAEIMRRQARFGGEWFAERYVPGRELNVAMIASDHVPHALPVAEIRFEGFPADKPHIVGFAAKWEPQSFEYRSTVRTFDVEAALAADLQRLALQCWDAFELSGYARVDFRVDADGNPWVLEVNANPCLSADAGFAAMLAAEGIDLSQALAWILADAESRRTVRAATVLGAVR
jgi:D-alanine-D-alanine ligase